MSRFLTDNAIALDNWAKRKRMKDLAIWAEASDKVSGGSFKNTDSRHNDVVQKLKLVIHKLVGSGPKMM